MKDFDRLSPDQRAVLALVLEQDRSYEQVASLLGMSEQTVRDRAHAALDALAHDTHPAAAGAHDAHLAAVGAHDAHLAAVGARDDGGQATPPAGSEPVRRGSRLGGALLLGALAAIVVVAAILISGGSGGGSKGSSQAASRPTASHSSSSSAATSASGGSTGHAGANGETPKLDKTLALSPVEPALKAAGVAYVLSQGKRRAFYVKAEGMPSSSGFFYAVWLSDSPSHSAPLGRAPTVKSDGRMEGGGPLPPNASAYHEILITRETDLHASHPGEVVLSGTFSIR